MLLPFHWFSIKRSSTKLHIMSLYAQIRQNLFNIWTKFLSICSPIPMIKKYVVIIVYISVTCIDCLNQHKCKPYHKLLREGEVSTLYWQSKLLLVSDLCTSWLYHILWKLIHIFLVNQLNKYKKYLSTYLMYKSMDFGYGKYTWRVEVEGN